MSLYPWESCFSFGEGKHSGQLLLLMTFSPEKVEGSIVQLKSIYTDAHSTGSKQEELEAAVHLEHCDTVGNIGSIVGWLEQQECSMDGYKLFRGDRQGRRDTGTTLLGNVLNVWSLRVGTIG